ncbi:hypothetical protein TNCV_608871 [Trichonephila clavipes]|nr:hypothetical protein TNCV_608871 [Trichonephila clavipes]
MRRPRRTDGCWVLFLLVPLSATWVCCVWFFLNRSHKSPETIQVVQDVAQDKILEASSSLEQYVRESTGRVQIRRILEFLGSPPGSTQTTILPRFDPELYRWVKPRLNTCGDPPLRKSFTFHYSFQQPYWNTCSPDWLHLSMFRLLRTLSPSSTEECHPIPNTLI